MQIDEIKLKNFGGISDLTVKPKKVNLLIGKNGAGKSTFLKAVKFGVVGGSMREDIIKEGENAASVSVVLDGHNVVKTKNRGGPSKFKLDGKTTSQKSITEMFFKDYGITDETMKFLSSSEVFENSSSSDFTEFLLSSGFIPLNLDINKFIDVAKKSGTMTPEVEEYIRNRFPAFPTEFDLSYIDTVDEGLEAEMKSLKNVMQNLKIKFESIAENPVIRNTKVIQKELDELNVQIGSIEANESIRKKVETFVKRIEDIQKEIDTMDSVKRPDPSILSDLQDNRAKTVKSIAQSETLINTFMSNNKVLKEQLTRLKDNKCPLSDKIVCSSDKSSVMENIENQIEENDIQINVLGDVKTEDSAKITDIDSKMAEYKKQEDVYNRYINLLNEQKRLKTAVDDIPEKSEVDLSKLYTKRDSLRVELNLASKQAERKDAIEEYEEKEKKLEFIKTCEVITSKTGKVKEQILTILLSALTGELNDLADKIGLDYKLAIDIDAKGNACIKCETPRGRQDYGSMSTGEKLMIQFLVMTEINQLSGFKLLVIDNIDKLDGNNFVKLMNFLETNPVVDTLYDHIFVATVDHNEFVDKAATLANVNVVKFA